jgi:hypothetical protein
MSAPGQSSQTDLVRCRTAVHAHAREVHARAYAAQGADVCAPLRVHLAVAPSQQRKRKRG